jgi:hypothetical protein
MKMLLLPFVVVVGKYGSRHISPAVLAKFVRSIAGYLFKSEVRLSPAGWLQQGI